MKRFVYVLFGLCLMLNLLLTPAHTSGAEGAREYDVVVYGGTSASVIAAVQVKKMGKSVVIVSPDTHLGGLSSGGLGATDSGNRTVIGGLSREFYHRIWKHYQNPSAWTWQEMPVKDGIPGQGGRGIDNDTQTMWVFEPHVAEMVFDGFVKEFDIPLFKNEWLDREKGVEKKGNQIISITTLSGKKFKGKMFLDTTYEGDLLAAAGVSYATGRESNSQYGETLNGIQVAHSRYHQFAGFVDPYIVPCKPESGLLPWVQPKINGEDGQGDNKIQAYNLRLCLTNVRENQVPFTKPEHYDPLQYELCLRSLEAGQKSFFTLSPMPNHKTDSNNNLAFSTDMIGGNYEYPDGSYEKRKEIYAAQVEWCRGLLWTLVSNPRVPVEMRASIAAWGLSKDEFQQTGHYPHQLYVREARRMISDFVVSERHLRYLDPTERPVGMGSYNMDSHHIQRYVDYEMYGKPSVRNEGDVQVNPGGPYPVDYLSLVPKDKDCGNLLVPVCISCTHIAFGSIRMEPVFMLLGQSAATAAILSLEKGVAPVDLDYAVLKERLLADGQVLEFASRRKTIFLQSLAGLVLDGDKAKLTGEWGSGTTAPRYVGVDYLHDLNEEKGEKSAQYRFTNVTPGKYDCRVSYSALGNRATNVPVEVRAGDKVISAKINQQLTPPIDELFISVGTILVDKEVVVTISNRDAKGHVIIDAVQLVPIK